MIAPSMQTTQLESADSDRVQDLPACYRLVLNSPELMRSGRLRVLLAHTLRVVESGTVDTLTERRIGIDVFKRNQDWDPTIDPCVRVAFGRLRLKLKTYYENFGQSDPTKITFAKGSYAPQVAHAALPVHDSLGASATTVIPVPALDSAAVVRPRMQISRYLFPAAGLLLLLIVTAWLWSYHLNRRAPERFQIVPFSTEAGAQFSPSISPDGSRIAYVWDRNNANFHIYVRPLDGGPAVLVPGGTGRDFYPSWSPDGSHLAFLRTDAWEGKLIDVSMASGSQQVVGSVTAAHGRWTEDSGPLLGDPGPVWSADGRELIALDQGHFGIYAVSIATGQRRQLTFDTETTRDFYPRVSRDGQWLSTCPERSQTLAGGKEQCRNYPSGS